MHSCFLGEGNRHLNHFELFCSAAYAKLRPSWLQVDI